MAAPNVTVQSSMLVPTLPQNFTRSLEWLTMTDMYLTACSSTVLTENQKFLALYNVLPAAVSSEESDLLTSNSVQKYTDLMTRLRTKFAVSVQSKFNILTKQEPIGDRTPSQYLTYIKKGYTLAGLTDNEAIKIAFARGLPDKWATFAHMADPNNLEDVAKKLDNLKTFDKVEVAETNVTYASQQNSSKISAKDTTNNSEKYVKPQDRFNGNNQQVKDGSFSSFYHNQNYGSRPQSYQQKFHDSRNDSCPEPPSRFNTYGLCPPHVRYGNETFRCWEQGCTWRQLRVPYHRCTLRICKWARYYKNEGGNNSYHQRDKMPKN